MAVPSATNPANNSAPLSETTGVVITLPAQQRTFEAQPHAAQACTMDGQNACQQSVDPFTKLPVELSLLILRYVIPVMDPLSPNGKEIIQRWNAVRLVCTRWNNLASDPAFAIMPSREACVFTAQLAGEAERFEEMVLAVKNLIRLSNAVLTSEERGLYSMAYKGLVESRRASLKVICMIEEQEVKKYHNEANVRRVQRYKHTIESEISNICVEALNTIEQVLLPRSGGDSEATVFYYKMLGDYHRYLAEITVGEPWKQAIEAARRSYERAAALQHTLRPTNPVRLALALNMSSFECEMLHNPVKAGQIAKQAFDLAIEKLDEEVDQRARARASAKAPAASPPPNTNISSSSAVDHTADPSVLRKSRRNTMSS